MTVIQTHNECETRTVTLRRCEKHVANLEKTVNKVSGDNVGGGTPVPIPNTAVKPS